MEEERDKGEERKKKGRSYPSTGVTDLVQSTRLLRPRGPHSARLLYPWGSPGRNTGVGCSTQGWNLHLLHRQVTSLPLSHQRSPKDFV